MRLWWEIDWVSGSWDSYLFYVFDWPEWLTLIRQMILKPWGGGGGQAANQSGMNILMNLPHGESIWRSRRKKRTGNEKLIGLGCFHLLRARTHPSRTDQLKEAASHQCKWLACRQVIVLIEFEGNRRNALINFPIKRWREQEQGQEERCFSWSSLGLGVSHRASQGAEGQWGKVLGGRRRMNFN